MQMLEQLKTELLALATTKRPLRVLAVEPGKEPLIAVGENEKHDPASMTKLMVFYLVCRAGGNIPETVKISQNAWDRALTKTHTPGYHKYPTLKVGDAPIFSAALSGMTTASDNVAANAIAETLGKGNTPEARYLDFIKQMNDAAASEELGMTNTHFINASGLPRDDQFDKKNDTNVTTAADMTKLITAIYREYPEKAKQYLENDSVQYGRLKEPKRPNHGLNNVTSPSYIGKDVISSATKTGYTDRGFHSSINRVKYADGRVLVVAAFGSGWTPLNIASKLGGKVEYPKAMVAAKSIKGNLVRDALIHNIVHYAASAKPPLLQLMKELTLPTLSDAITFQSGDNILPPPLMPAAPSFYLER